MQMGESPNEMHFDSGLHEAVHCKQWLAPRLSSLRLTSSSTGSPSQSGEPGGTS
jgi:hypothetical protein